MSFNEAAAPEDIYRQMQFNYAKFFKMDILCKWAWLGAETLLMNNGISLLEGIDKSKIGLVMMTSHGCLEVDKKYHDSISDIPSPALFVYTLPNIMLGEICIRHGIKGEQACLVSDTFDTDEIEFWVKDLLGNRGMDACICGWADATADNHEVSLYWVTKTNKGIPFSAADMQQLDTTK